MSTYNLLPLFFFFNDTATTEIYTLSLHDALPICHCHHRAERVEARADDARPRSAPVGPLHRERGGDCLDRVRDHLGVSVVWTRPCARPRATRGGCHSGPRTRSGHPWTCHKSGGSSVARCVMEDPGVLCRRRTLRLRKRPRDRAVSLRRCSAAVPLAQRATVHRRRRGLDDHARTGGDHGRVHRLSRRRTRRRDPRRTRGLPARLSRHGALGPAFPSRGEEPAGEGVRGRRDGGGDWRDRRCGGHLGPAVALGRADDAHRRGDPGAPNHPQEDPGTGVDPGGGACRACAQEPAVKQRVTFALAGISLLTRVAVAQDENSPHRGGRASAGKIQATLIRAPVTLDGRLDESFWATADSIDDFRQREPREGSPATERTVVKVAHDADALYIVVRCYDSDMRAVRASQLRRDADLSSDDNVRLLIDSFDDRRGAFVLGTNPSGAMLVAELNRPHDLELYPYALGRAVETEHDSSGGETTSGYLGGKAGVDAKLAITPTLTGDLTVNTDFAQVEADQQVINLTRFPFFFPEKRGFFLESSGLLDLGTPGRVQLFYSRRVGLDTSGAPVPILAGGRVYGRLGPWKVGILDAQTGAGDNANDAVVRVQHDLFARSYIGGIGTLHAGPRGQGVERAGGLDIDLPLIVHGGNLEPKVWIAGSQTPGVPGTPLAWRISTDNPNDLFDNFISLYPIDSGFAPPLGFVRRTGVWETTGHVDFMPRPGVLGIRQLDFTFPIPSWDVIANEKGSLFRSADWQTAWFEWRVFGGDRQNGDHFEVNFQRLLDAPTDTFDIFRGVAIPPGRYWWSRYELQYFMNPGRPLSVGAFVNSGQFYGGPRAGPVLMPGWRGAGPPPSTHGPHPATGSAPTRAVTG